MFKREYQETVYCFGITFGVLDMHLFKNYFSENSSSCDNGWIVNHILWTVFGCIWVPLPTRSLPVF